MEVGDVLSPIKPRPSTMQRSLLIARVCHAFKEVDDNLAALRILSE
jgi:hypothetical protein